MMLNETYDPAVDLSRLKTHPKNPRRGDLAAISESIDANGFYGAAVVQKSTGFILAGNHRFLALKEQNASTMPVIWVDVDDTKALKILLADNRTSDLGGYDDNALTSLLADISNTVGLKGTGYDEADLEAMIAELAGGDSGPRDSTEDDVIDANEALTKKWGVERGQIWQVGRHRIMCGDSTCMASVQALMGGGTADMVLTDPPYGVSYVGKTKDARKVANDDLNDADLTRLIAGAFDCAQQVSRAGAYWYATVPARPLHTIFVSDWIRRGILRQTLVWVKDSMVLGHSEYHYQHEPILFGWVPGGKRHKNADRTRTTCWFYDRPKASLEHPTMKPVALWEQAVEDGSRKGELVMTRSRDRARLSWLPRTLVVARVRWKSNPAMSPLS